MSHIFLKNTGYLSFLDFSNHLRSQPIKIVSLRYFDLCPGFQAYISLNDCPCGTKVHMGKVWESSLFSSHYYYLPDYSTYVLCHHSVSCPDAIRAFLLS